MNETSNNSCFAVMPISDTDGYENGHFTRVYEHLIKPACKAADFHIDRADESSSTNLIILEILRRVVTADVVICDLSSRNPNVFYELGVRQAFDKPVVLIKDKKTSRVFDIQGLRTIEYDQSLRVDTIQQDAANLAEAISQTSQSKPDEVNSMIRLLGMTKAEFPQTEPIANETKLVLEALSDISRRISDIEITRMGRNSYGMDSKIPDSQLLYKLPNGETARRGEEIMTSAGGPTLGYLVGVDSKGVVLRDRKDENVIVIISKDNPLYKKLTTIPF